MYQITKNIHAHFSHHVRGHRGACISLHGHTWKLEVTIAADELDREGFVRDFGDVRALVLEPCHRLLDHSLALGEATWAEAQAELVALGQQLVRSREIVHGSLGDAQAHLEGELAGARNEMPGGIKVAVFPFSPTSERLAEWLFRVATERLADGRVSVVRSRVYETLHPGEAIAEWIPRAR